MRTAFVRQLATAAIGIVAAIGAAAPAAAVQSLVNGDFENTGFGGTSGYYNIGLDHAVPADFGFLVPVNNVDIIANGVYTPFLATGGAYNLDLVGYGSTGAISQSFATVAGRVYSVSLDYTVNGAGTADVTVDSLLLGTIVGTGTWQSFTSSFVGTGSAVTFAVTETVGGNSGGVVLDNLSVTSVPEASTWLLMIAGFGMVGVARRRQRPIAA